MRPHLLQLSTWVSRTPRCEHTTMSTHTGKHDTTHACALFCNLLRDRTMLLLLFAMRCRSTPAACTFATLLRRRSGHARRRHMAEAARNEGEPQRAGSACNKRGNNFFSFLNFVRVSPLVLTFFFSCQLKHFPINNTIKIYCGQALGAQETHLFKVIDDGSLF